MSGVTGDSLDRVNERRVKIGLEPKGNLHITLLKMHINKDSQVMMGGELQPGTSVRDIALDTRLLRLLKTICQIYIDVYLGNQLNFESQMLNSQGNVIGGLWEILGGRYGRNLKEKFNGKYFARVFNAPDDARKFRTELWSYMGTEYGASLSNSFVNRRGLRGDVEDFKIYTDGPRGEELYALDKFNDNFDSWKPHISVLTFGELKQIESPVYEELWTVERSNISDDSKQREQIRILKEAIGSVRPMSKIRSDSNLHNPFIGLNSYGDKFDFTC